MSRYIANTGNSSRLRSRNCFSCFAVASTKCRDTELGVTPKALPASVTVSSYLRERHSSKHLRQEFLREASSIFELLIRSQHDLTLRAAQPRVLDTQLLVTHIDRPALTRPFH